MFKNRFKIVFGKVVLLLVSTIVALLLAEIVLRQIINVNPSTPSEYRVPHHYFGWALIPDVSYINTHLSKRVSQ